MNTRNQHIKLMSIGNTYGHYTQSDIADRLHGDIAHFAKKHGRIPTHVLMPPNLIPEQREVDVDGVTVRLIEDSRQLKACYTVVSDDIAD